MKKTKLVQNNNNNNNNNNNKNGTLFEIPNSTNNFPIINEWQRSHTILHILNVDIISEWLWERIPFDGEEYIMEHDRKQPNSLTMLCYSKLNPIQLLTIAFGTEIKIPQFFRKIVASDYIQQYIGDNNTFAITKYNPLDDNHHQTSPIVPSKEKIMNPDEPMTSIVWTKSLINPPIRLINPKHEEIHTREEERVSITFGHTLRPRINGFLSFYNPYDSVKRSYMKPQNVYFIILSEIHQK